MSADPFNSIAGYSAGIPPVAVIDANGNVVTNVNTVGNVTANVVYATYYKFANGSPFTGTPGGNDTQVQFNNAGSFGGIPNVSWNGNTLTLGDVSALSITGGLNGYFLQTDGTGNLTWAAGGNGACASPGGSNTQVQYNDNGVFGGDVDFVFDKTTNTLTVPTVNAVSHITAAGNITSNANIQANGYFVGNGYYLTGIASDLANYVIQPNQSNITSLGNLLYLDITGDINSSGNANFSGNIVAGNLNLSRNVSASNATFASNVTVNGNLRVNYPGTLRSLGNVNFSGSPNINLGTLANIRISGGVNGYVLSTDGTGNLSWTAGGGGGGNGVPGGSNTQIQYNDSGDFGGSPYLTFNDVTNTFNIAGNLIANSIEIGSGVYKFSRSNVYFATTATMANTSLVSLNANSVSSVDYTVIATDITSGNRQVSKLSAVMFQATCNYNEYSTLSVNGLVGNLTVGYDPGNIISPASVTLYVEPTNTNLSSYKIQMTVYEE
jgi:hypothetical protein